MLNIQSIYFLSEEIRIYILTMSMHMYMILYHCLSQLLTIRLEESECFSAWVMGCSTSLDKATPDIKRETNTLHALPHCVAAVKPVTLS